MKTTTKLIKGEVRYFHPAFPTYFTSADVMHKAEEELRDKINNIDPYKEFKDVTDIYDFFGCSPYSRTSFVEEMVYTSENEKLHKYYNECKKGKHEGKTYGGGKLNITFNY